MAEALTQSQIDALLNKMQSGEIEEKPAEPEINVKEYDFATPKKFTKDQLKSLSNIYENYSRLISSYFTSILRTACEISIIQVEEQRYYEFSNALADNTLIGIVSFVPENEKEDPMTVMLELATSFGYLALDRLMGGKGELTVPDRDYTFIELCILKNVMEKISVYLQEVWSTVYPLETKLMSVETDGRFIQTFQPQDVVLIITLDISDENYKGNANICMPAENLEKIINSFFAKHNRPTKHLDEQKEKRKRDNLMEALKLSEVKMEARLDECLMTLGDISQLQVNDVIALNKKINEDVVVNIEGIPIFKARLGGMDTQKAVKLVGIENYTMNERDSG